MLKVGHLVSLVAIVVLATWLRTTQLPTLGILYGDAAHDLWSAKEAVESKQLPLLGIESSIPRFRQGPVTVWLNMVIYSVFGQSYLPYAVIYSFTSILAVIALFFLVKKEHSFKPALIASFLLAISPLAIAHARVSFIISPLPLVLVVWLWAVLRLKEKTPKSVFLAFLAWGFLFQFELAVTPLLAVVFFEVWQHHKKISKELFLNAAGGLLVGLSPQIIHDLTHKGEQLGGFIAWVGYRITTAFIPTTDHALGLDTFKTAFTAITHYGTKLFVVAPTSNSTPFLAVLFLLFSFVALVSNFKKLRSISPLSRISTLSVGILLLAFIIHGSPSEAYFPPFLVLIPLLLSSLWMSTKDSLPKVLTTVFLLAWLGTRTVLDIAKTEFFTNTSHHFNYGPSVGSQVQALHLIKELSSEVALQTTHPAGIYPNYFDNLKWLAKENNLTITTSEKAQTTVWVEDKDSSLIQYPGAFIVTQNPYYLVWLP